MRLQVAASPRIPPPTIPSFVLCPPLVVFAFLPLTTDCASAWSWLCVCVCLSVCCVRTAVSEMLNESKHSTPNGSEYAFPVGDSPGGEGGGVNAGSGSPDTPQPLAVIHFSRRAACSEEEQVAEKVTQGSQHRKAVQLLYGISERETQEQGEATGASGRSKGGRERETGVNLNKSDAGGEVRGRRLAPSSSLEFTLA